MTRVKKFLALNTQQKRLFLHAVWLLLVYRVALTLRPLQHITRSFRHDKMPQARVPITPQQQVLAEEVGQLVAWAALATPWPSRCLVQVLVVQHLLAARDIPGQFFLGVNHAGAGATDSLAHAWLCCGDTIVSGEQGADQYAVVSSYAW